MPVSDGEHLDNVLRHMLNEPTVVAMESVPRCELRRDTMAATAHDLANMVPNNVP